MIAKCVKCGFKAAECMFLDWVCHGCRIMEGEKRMDAPPKDVEMILCACGCGKLTERFNKNNLERKYVNRDHQYNDKRRAARISASMKKAMEKKWGKREHSKSGTAGDPSGPGKTQASSGKVA